MDLTAGSTFAGYRIERLAGRGGMGVVYRATQLRLDRPAALKLIAPDLACDPLFRSRFVTESQLAASIDHPNVIPIYEAGDVDDTLFISMRWVSGHDLSSVIKHSDRLDPARAARIIVQVAAALDAAHNRGLVHRDVKPANVLIAANGDEHAYLTDFGLTKRVTATSGLTKSGQFLGTIDYIAPEQIREEPADARSDVYSLGCLLYHCLTGNVPFQKGSEVAKIYAHLHAAPPRPSEAVASLDGRFDEVIGRALAKEPDERFSSAGDLGKAALAAADRRPLPLADRSVATGAAAMPTATPARVQPTATGATLPAADNAGARRRRRRVAIGAGAFGLLAAFVAVTVVLAGGSDQIPQRETGSDQIPQPETDTIRVAARPHDLVVDDSKRVWVSDKPAKRLLAISTSTSKAARLEPIPLPTEPSNLAKGPGGIWVAGRGKRVYQLKAGAIPTGAAKADLNRALGPPVIVRNNPAGMATGRGYVWLTMPTAQRVGRFDPLERQVEELPAGRRPIRVLVGSKFVWVINEAGEVSRLDPVSGTRRGTTDIGVNPSDVVETRDGVWVTNADDDTVSRLDPSDGSEQGTIEVGDRPGGLAAGEGYVWVVNRGDETVSRIDPRTAEVVGKPIPVGSDPRGITVDWGSVWVTNYADRTVTRIRP